MFIYTVKGQNVKLVCSILASLLVIVLVVALTPGKMNEPGLLEAAAIPTESDCKGVDTPEARIAFLKARGYDVENHEEEISMLTIPAVWNPYFQAYNEMQKKQGMDLESYKGKSVERYTFVIKNYDYNGTVLADLIIYEGRVIAGDVRSAQKDGFLHGFDKSNAIGV